MDSKTKEWVTIIIDANRTVRGRELTKRVAVSCEKPKLEAIYAEYDGDDLIVGSEIDRNDVTVTAYYSDDTEEEVYGWEFDSYRLTEGTNYITVYYEEGDEEAEDEIEIDAFEGKLKYITASYSGAYVTVGGKVNNANIKVTGVYDADRYVRATATLNGWYLKNYTINEGNNTITVVYKEDGETFEDTINVVGKVQQTSTTTPTANKAGTWAKVGNKWKWKLNNNTYLKNDWVQENGNWYFIDANTDMVALEWRMIDGKWYYFNGDGSMATGWKLLDGKWYFLDEVNGDMFTGWKLWNDKYYYLIPGSGEMATNRWIQNWYVDGDGVWTQTR